MLYKHLLITSILFTGLIGFAQPKNIRLPDGNEKIELKDTSPVFNIYITKDQEVYFEDSRIHYFDEIASSILKAKRNLPKGSIWLYAKIYLHADIETQYALIDAIKTEIANASGKKFVYLKTGKSDTPEQATPNRIYYSADAKLPTPILTLKEEMQNRNLNKMAPPPPLPPPSYPIIELENSILSGDKKAIENELPKYKYDAITLLDNGNFFHGNIEYGVSDSKTIKKIIESVDLLFIHFSKNLQFGGYVKSINVIRKAYAELGGKSIKNKKRIIEFTSALQKTLKERGIEHFD